MRFFTHPALTKKYTAYYSFAHAAQHGQNDCEAIVSELYPPVQNAIVVKTIWQCQTYTGTGLLCLLTAQSVEQTNKILAKSTVDGFGDKRLQSLALHTKHCKISLLGVSPNGKAAGFDPPLRWFESNTYPCHIQVIHQTFIIKLVVF